MTQTLEAELHQLRQVFAGRLITPDDPDSAVSIGRRNTS